MVNTHNDTHTAFSDYGKSFTLLFMLGALGGRAYYNNPTTPQDDIQESLMRINKLVDSKNQESRDHRAPQDFKESVLLKHFRKRADYITNINDFISQNGLSDVIFTLHPADNWDFIKTKVKQIEVYKVIEKIKELDPAFDTESQDHLGSFDLDPQKHFSLSLNQLKAKINAKLKDAHHIKGEDILAELDGFDQTWLR